MPSTTDRALGERLASQRNVTILTAIAVALPAAYWFHTAFGDGPGDFLLLMAVAVGVPTAADLYGPDHGRLWRAVATTAVASVAVGAAFVGVYVLGTGPLSLSPFVASVMAFLVAELGPLAALRAFRTAREEPTV